MCKGHGMSGIQDLSQSRQQESAGPRQGIENKITHNVRYTHNVS